MNQIAIIAGVIALVVVFKYIKWDVLRKDLTNLHYRFEQAKKEKEAREKKEDGRRKHIHK